MSFNIYTDPERFGLELVKDHDADGCYSFSIVAVWRWLHSGEYLIAHDAGCSCPCPFEETGVLDLKPVRTLADVADFAREQEFDETAVAALIDGLTLTAVTA